jgi:hypothetical protein
MTIRDVKVDPNSRYGTYGKHLRRSWPENHHSGTEISASPIIFFAPPNIALPIHRGVIVTWHLMIYTHEAFTSESQDLSCGEMDL